MRTATIAYFFLFGVVLQVNKTVRGGVRKAMQVLPSFHLPTIR